jgi:TonB-dependent starch-binding outer membrane protein SusC
MPETKSKPKSIIMRRKPLPKFLGKAGWILLWCLFLSPAVYAQNVVSGTVKDAAGQGLPGVNVLLKGTTQGSVTAADGRFSIEAPANGTLTFSFIGYATKEVAVNGQTNIDVILEEDITSLEEVVVVGYGTVKKSDVTGSVASVTPKKLQEVITIDVNNALQGRVAGVQVINNSGRPGAGTTVRIRGVGSMNNSDPLYVVDGFPTGDISFLAPGDIESMEVLKDASAAAIYGNRGANGVILITTKKGKEGTTTFNFNSFVGVQQPVRKLDLLNASEYAQLYMEAWSNDGVDVETALPPQDYAMFRYVIDNNLKGTDWQDEVMVKSAPIQSYSLDAMGGTDKYKFRFSSTYFDQEGNIKNTNLRKFFIKLNNEFQLSKKFTAGVNISYLRAIVGNYNGDQYSGVLPTVIGASPIIPAYDRDPLWNQWGATQLFSQSNNGARIVDELKNQGWNQHKLVSNLWAEWKLLKNLSFRSNFSNDLSFDQSRNYYPQFSIRTDFLNLSSERRERSQLDESRGTAFNWNWANFITYEKTLNEAHSINVMVGQEANYSKWDGINATAYKVPNIQSQMFLSGAKDINSQTSSGASITTLLSYFGRLNYSYKSKYLFTATGRYDGSSRFTKSNRWGFFPSFAVAWNVTNEAFFDNVAWLSNMKIRGGYGEVGNQSVVGPADFVTQVTNRQRYSFNNKPVEGQIPTRLSNAELVWESSNMSNVGVDFGFLDDKLALTLEYFIRDTEDMIVGIPVPEYVGAYAPNANAGTMRNKGFEFNVTYNGQAGDLKFDIGLNGSFIRNELVNLGGGQPYEAGGVSKVGNTGKVMEGMPFPFFFGYQTDGIFNSQEELDAHVNADGTPLQPLASPGDVKFVDTNNDGVINPGDRVNLGNAYPDFTAGLSLGAEYKGFDLKAFFYGSFGNEAVNSLIGFNEFPTGLQNSTRNRLDRWTTENTSSDEPRMTQQNRNDNMRFSDRYVEDASFIKLRNIQVGYRLPTAITEKLHLRSVRVYVSGDNLWRNTKYKGFDPEFGSLYSSPFYYGVDLANYPQARTIIGGLNVTF